METNMTAAQALGELNGMVRMHKAMSKLSEVLAVAAELEKTEAQLRKNSEVFTKQAEELVSQIDANSVKLKQLQDEVAGTGPKVQQIINEARDKASNMVLEATKEAERIAGVSKEKENSLKGYLEALRQEVTVLDRDKKKLAADLNLFRDAVKKEKERVLATLGAT